MKNLKRAFEELYKDVQLPEELEYATLLKIERYKRKRLLRILAVESVFLFLLLSFVVYEKLKPAEYTTMGLHGVQVKLIKDVSFLKVSQDLETASLRIEGPYADRVFLLKGKEEDVQNFLRRADYLRSLD